MRQVQIALLSALLLFTSGCAMWRDSSTQERVDTMQTLLIAVNALVADGTIVLSEAEAQRLDAIRELLDTWEDVDGVETRLEKAQVLLDMLLDREP